MMDGSYGIERELEVSANTRNTSSPPQCEGTITATDYLQACCRILYRIRKLKNKGAILVLVWSFLVMSVYSYLFDSLLPALYHDLVVYSALAVIGAMLVIAGWLADVQFGQYKVLSYSIWVMWLSTTLLAMKWVVFSLLELSEDSLMSQILNISLIIVLALGLGAFQANIIQFGIDQLNDASTTEITSFVAWYTWTIISSDTVASLFNILTCFDSKYFLLGPFLTASCLTIIVSTNYFIIYTIFSMSAVCFIVRQLFTHNYS